MSPGRTLSTPAWRMTVWHNDDLWLLLCWLNNMWRCASLFRVNIDRLRCWRGPSVLTSMTPRAAPTRWLHEHSAHGFDSEPKKSQEESAPPTSASLLSPLLCPRRTFLASVILASKFSQDTGWYHWLHNRQHHPTSRHHRHRRRCHTQSDEPPSHHPSFVLVGHS